MSGDNRPIPGRMMNFSAPFSMNEDDNVSIIMPDGSRADTRIVSLNIRHGGGRRADSILNWIFLRSPDILVLSEWRDNATGSKIRNELETNDYALSTFCGAGKNGLLLAAKDPFTATQITPQECERGEICLAQMGELTICAVYFPQEKAKLPFFGTLFKLAEEFSERRLLIIGDFNTGRDDLDREGGSVKFTYADRFCALESEAGLVDLWRNQHGPDVKEWSWRSSKNGFRIDHAFATPAAAENVVNCVYFPETRSLGITDHAALFVRMRNK